MSSTAPASEPAPPPAEPGGEGKKLKFQTAFTVLATVLLLVWVASFFVPAGDYRINPETAGPVPGTYRELPIENDRGFVSADEQRFLYGSAMIFLLVVAVGAFITVTLKTEAIHTGIGRLALRFRHSGSLLIATLMTAYQSASGLVHLLTPTSAVIMGGLALSKVGYDRYLKFFCPSSPWPSWSPACSSAARPS